MIVNYIKYVEVVHETEKAILIKIDDKFQAWVPKGLISENDDNELDLFCKFDLNLLPIVNKDDVLDMFDDISGPIDEPDFSDVVVQSKNKYPTPFD